MVDFHQESKDYTRLVGSIWELIVDLMIGTEGWRDRP